VQARVVELKSVLDAQASTPTDVLEALGTLSALGDIPTKVFATSMIGKSVNTLAKASPDEAVKAKARELVEAWRQTHRRRKSSGDLTPSLKRSASSTASLGDGLSQDSTAAATAGASPSKAARTASFATVDPGALQATQEGELQKQDSQASLTGDGARPKGELTDDQRDKVRKKLVEVLGKSEEVETKGDEQAGDEKMRDPVTLAAEIEQELSTALPKKEAYMNQARSILYNLKDPKNKTFGFKLMVGFYKPQDVPGLSAEDMASDEKNAQRAKQRQDAMEEIDQGWAMKHGQMRLTGMFTCGKCKGTKTTYFQMQTRSSDEPMTTFVTCLTCNNRWKFC
jgi:transcription elongation factor S-II